MVVVDAVGEEQGTKTVRDQGKRTVRIVLAIKAFLTGLRFPG